MKQTQEFFTVILPMSKTICTSKLFLTHDLFSLSNGFLRLTDQARTKYTRILNNKYKRTCAKGLHMSNNIGFSS